MKVTAIMMDITKIGEKADAIVNAANESLLGGGGVDGAIHAAAGIELYHECKTLGGCKPGDAKVTKAYKLKNKCIIHTVGPRYYADSNPPSTLASCYKRCLELADELCLSTIAFPSISTGVFGYPVEEAASIAAKVICKFEPKHLKEAFMCVYFNEYELDTYKKAFSKYDN